MKRPSDQELLRRYVRERSEEAFAELVERHVGLVYSAALRVVADVHQAQDIVQGVFLALSLNAAQLQGRPILAGWLHRTTQNIAVKSIRGEARRRTREQQAVHLRDLPPSALEDALDEVMTHLDASLSDLTDDDRDAVLLRYFERRSAEEIGQILGISAEAAQKRLRRAIEKLRHQLVKRGVVVGASSLAACLSTNLVQAAPAGLVTGISTAFHVSNPVFHSITTATATPTLVMTTLQKAVLVSVIVAATAGVIGYQHRVRSILRQENAALRAQVAQQSLLEDENHRLSTALAAVTDSAGRTPAPASSEQLTELLRLRGEVGRLRRQDLDFKTRLMEQEQEDPAVVARVKLPFAQADLEKLTRLHGQKLVSDSQLREAEANVALLSAEARGDLNEAAALRVQAAEESLQRLSELHVQKLASDQSLLKAKRELELRRAEQTGDRAAVARLRLQHAEEEAARLKTLYDQKLIGEFEMKQAAVEVELLRAKSAGR